MITSQYAIVEGELQLPLRDLCDEKDSKKTYEVAGVSQYPSAYANTMVDCITLIKIQIISLLINYRLQSTETAENIRKTANKKHANIRECL